MYAKSGGFQRIINVDNGGQLHAMKYYKGLTEVQTVS